MKIKFTLKAFAVVVIFSSCRFENIGRDLSAGLNKNTEAIGKI